jgi:hypothetical protein
MEKLASESKRLASDFPCLMETTVSHLVLYMESHESIDYYSLFSELVTRQAQLVQRRNEIDREVTKLRQLILDTFPLLPEDKQSLLQAEIEEMEEQSGGF